MIVSKKKFMKLLAALNLLFIVGLMFLLNGCTTNSQGLIKNAKREIAIRNLLHQKELEKIDKQNQKLIFEKIKDLEAGNFSNDKTLKGKHKGKFRKRAGDYRIIYLKENNTIAIIVIECSEKLLNFTQASCNFCQGHRLKILLKSANASAPSGLSALFSPNGEHKIFKLKLQSFRSIYNFSEVSIKIKANYEYKKKILRWN